MWVIGSGEAAVIMERGVLHPNSIARGASRSVSEAYVSDMDIPLVETQPGSPTITLSGKLFPGRPRAIEGKSIELLERLEGMRDRGDRIPVIENGRRLGGPQALWEILDATRREQILRTLPDFTRQGSAEPDTRALRIDWTVELRRVR